MGLGMETIDVEGDVIRITDDAVLIDVDGVGDVWFPLSQIAVEPAPPVKDETVTVTMPTWMAKDRGIPVD